MLRGVASFVGIKSDGLVDGDSVSEERRSSGSTATTSYADSEAGSASTEDPAAGTGGPQTGLLRGLAALVRTEAIHGGCSAWNAASLCTACLQASHRHVGVPVLVLVLNMAVSGMVVSQWSVKPQRVPCCLLVLMPPPPPPPPL